MKTFNKFSYLDIDSSVIKLENQVKVWQNSIDDTNLKKLNILNEIERNKTLADMKKMDKLAKRRDRVDKKIEKMKKEIGL